MTVYSFVDGARSVTLGNCNRKLVLICESFPWLSVTFTCLNLHLMQLVGDCCFVAQYLDFVDGDVHFTS